MTIIVVVLAEYRAIEAGGNGRAVGAEVAKDARRLVHHGRARSVEAAVVHGEELADLWSTGCARGAWCFVVMRPASWRGRGRRLKRCRVYQHQELGAAVAE
jgi:hypothetical protein